MTSAFERPRSGATVEVETDVQPDVQASWDQARMGTLVTSIVQRELGPGDYVVSLHLVGDEAIRELNRDYRGTDTHTDVLSFPLHDPDGMRFVLPPGQRVALGDVVVSYPRVQEQAREYGHSEERELAYLVAHGVLHILGYDHEEPDEQARMREREEEALAPLGLTR